MPHKPIDNYPFPPGKWLLTHKFRPHVIRNQCFWQRLKPNQNRVLPPAVYPYHNLHFPVLHMKWRVHIDPHSFSEAVMIPNNTVQPSESHHIEHKYPRYSTSPAKFHFHFLWFDEWPAPSDGYIM